MAGHAPRRTGEQGDLTVVYQPVVDLVLGRIAGVEALIRQIGPDGELLRPDAFLDDLFRSGGARLVTDTVLDAARALLGGSPGAPWWVSVNLGLEDLADPTLLDRLRQATDGIDRRRLVLEITEQVVPNDAARCRLQRLADLGLALALDDLGSSCSSARQLDQLPVELVKLDRRLTQALGRPDGGITPSQLHTFVEICGVDGLTVVAEGVETIAEAAAVRAAGVRFGQGYLWYRPAPAEHLAGLPGLTGWPAPARVGTGRQPAHSAA